MFSRRKVVGLIAAGLVTVAADPFTFSRNEPYFMLIKKFAHGMPVDEKTYSGNVAKKAFDEFMHAHARPALSAWETYVSENPTLERILEIETRWDSITLRGTNADFPVRIRENGPVLLRDAAAFFQTVNPFAIIKGDRFSVEDFEYADNGMVIKTNLYLGESHFGIEKPTWIDIERYKKGTVASKLRIRYVNNILPIYCRHKPVEIKIQNPLFPEEIGDYTMVKFQPQYQEHETIVLLYGMDTSELEKSYNVVNQRDKLVACEYGSYVLEELSKAHLEFIEGHRYLGRWLQSQEDKAERNKLYKGQKRP